jgi:DNA-binding NarL/FixJ family response regulator
LERGIELARAGGQGQFLVEMLQGRALALVALGRLDEALAVADQGLATARLDERPQPLAWSLWLRALVLTERGDVAAALTAGEEGLTVGRAAGPILVAAGTWVVAAALLAAGRPRDARDLILEGCGGPDLNLSVASVRCSLWATLAEADAQLGDPDAAAGWADRAGLWAARIDLPISRSHARRAEALARLAAGDTAGAHAAALAAATEADGADARLAALRARVVAARAQADGEALLRSVLEEAEGLGALTIARDAAAELRRRGLSAPPLGERGLPGLTERQADVAWLVAAGRTNRAIAAELAMSEKTVETHLRAIFERWDVHTRAAVAARAAGQPGRSER